MTRVVDLHKRWLADPTYRSAWQDTAKDITESSGNMFADLGLPDPEEELAKTCRAIEEKIGN